MNVLLINLPPSGINFSNTNDITSASYIFPPMGLMSLASKLCKVDPIKKIECLDFSTFDMSCIDSFDKLNDFIHDKLLDYKELNPKIICISLMFSSSYDFFVLVVKCVKALYKNSVIICGGVHATSTVDTILFQNEEVDYVICGEGEKALPQLIYSIADDIKPDILGVHYRDCIKYSSLGTKFEITSVIDNIDFDFKSAYECFDMNLYTNSTSLFSLTNTSIQEKAFSIMASRGCPVRCIFCAAQTVHGHTPRWRSINNIRDEILWLHEHYNVKKIYLMDDNFVPKSKAIELFNMIANLKIPDFDVVIQNMSINHTDFEILDVIANAGISYIPLAIESGSKEIQKKIKKYCNLDKAIQLVQYIKKIGLQTRCFYIIGFPGETIEQMQETIDFSIKVGADWSTFSVAVPFPGSEMYEEFLKLGYIENTPHFWKAATIRDRVFDTPEISAADIKALAYTANLKANFVYNPNILNGEYEKAEIVFSNFVKSFDFHIFGHDCLRRIYHFTDQVEKEKSTLEHMRLLMRTNNKSKEFGKYLYLLDEQIRDYICS